MTVTAVYDANVLYPSLLRDVLIRVAIAGAVRARWSDQILDEVFRNISESRPELDRGLLTRTRTLMNEAVRDALVTGFEDLVDDLALPDENDRHVLAAAIHSQAAVIVTINLKDFPAADLEPYGVAAQHPDAFLSTLFAADPAAMTDAIRRISAASRRPPRTTTDVIERLDASGLPAVAALLRDHFRTIGS